MGIPLVVSGHLHAGYSVDTMRLCCRPWAAQVLCYYVWIFSVDSITQSNDTRSCVTPSRVSSERAMLQSVGFYESMRATITCRERPVAQELSRPSSSRREALIDAAIAQYGDRLDDAQHDLLRAHAERLRELASQLSDYPLTNADEPDLSFLVVDRVDAC
jgi:hypothetical protein